MKNNILDVYIDSDDEIKVPADSSYLLYGLVLISNLNYLYTFGEADMYDMFGERENIIF